MSKSVIKIIKNPRITEKGTSASASNAYVFDVVNGVSKTEIKEAIFEIYKVYPVKVNVTKVPVKRVFSRGIKGTKSGGRKAFVYLKAEDKIEFI